MQKMCIRSGPAFLWPQKKPKKHNNNGLGSQQRQRDNMLRFFEKATSENLFALKQCR